MAGWLWECFGALGLVKLLIWKVYNRFVPWNMGLVRVSGPLWGSERSIWQIRQLLPVHGTYAPTGGACVQAHAQLGAQDILWVQWPDRPQTQGA